MKQGTPRDNQTGYAAAERKIRTKDLVLTALMAAVLCIVSPWSIPIGPIPVSLSLFAIYLTMYLLGAKLGTMSVLLYLLIGLLGLPVFSNFTGGPQKLFGPTGGFLIGYLPMALLIGLFLDHTQKEHSTFWRMLFRIVVVFACTWVLYLFGTIWYMFLSGTDFIAALSVTVLPFVLIDLVKNILAAVLGPAIRKRIR